MDSRVGGGIAAAHRKISRLGLGTVQFGFNYGINNARGQVPYDEVLRILEFGAAQGVTFLDTSRAYGASEEALGRAMEAAKLQDTCMVCTKLDLPPGYASLDAASLRETVLDGLHRSQDALRLDQIPAYLLHTPEYRTVQRGLVWQVLLEQVEAGTIGLLGVSIARGPDEALQCLADPTVRILQIPYNILDQRWRCTGVLDACLAQGVALVNRSTYLQGLMLMDPELAHVKVPASVPFLQQLQDVADEASIPVKELVLRYALSCEALSCTLIGVDSLSQFEENIGLYHLGALDDALVQQIERMFADTPVELVNPALWGLPYNAPKRMQ